MWWSVGLVLGVLFVGAADGTECKKQKELGDLPENLYYCKEQEKPECCQVKKEFTCCEPKFTRNLKEQLQLWGTVIAIVVVMLVVCVCFKKDINICNMDRPLRETFCKKRKLQKQEGNHTWFKPGLQDQINMGFEGSKNKMETNMN